jgi:RNA polymerase sigma factor (sigma-70 family)
MMDVNALLSRLQRAVDRCCPPHLRDSRDDIVQNALMKATTAQNAGRSVNATWLRKVAYTCMIDEIRQRGVVADDTERQPSPQPDPERQTRLARIRDALDRCMAHLAVPRRRAVVLFLQGHSAREAASLLSLEQRAAENLIFRGRAELRTCLEASGATLESL